MSTEQHSLADAIKHDITAEHNLKHVEAVHDASAPILPSANKLMSEITSEHHLKHVETVHDASAPIIDPNAHVGKNQHGALLSELVTKGTFSSSSYLNYDILVVLLTS